MPIRSGRRHRAHDFASHDDPALLRSALVVQHAERVGKTSIRLVLDVARVGHAFPTGDLLRRLEVVAEARDEHGAIGGRAVRFLSRHFERRKDAAGLLVPFEVADDRVGVSDAPREVLLDVGAPANGRTVAWSIRYQRVMHARSEDERASLVADEVTLAEGELAPRTCGMQ